MVKTHFSDVPATALKAIKAFLPQFGELEHNRTAPSSVTTAWGVQWDEELVARDLMQNFRDANKVDLDAIKVIQKGANVMIKAPAEFNLQRLFFLGSEKGEGDIGAFGEGFKAAALALLRDFQVDPIAISGKNVVRLTVSEETVEDTELRPIVYDFFTHDGDTPGSYLLVLGCPAKLASAIVHSMQHFFWANHPLLGECLMSSAGIEVYRATKGSSGWGFYQGLRRCEIPHIPLIFHVKKPNKTLDKKMAADRDRKAFNDQVAASYYNVIARNLDLEVMRECLRLSQPYWTSGSALLSAIAQEARKYGWDSADFMSGIIDTKKFFAATEVDLQYAKHEPALREIAADFKEQGRKQLPSYFTAFGVPSFWDEKEAREKAMRDKARELASAPPTPMERLALDVLNRALGDLYPALKGGLHHFNYVVCQSEEILGQLRTGLRYGSSEVLLEASLFLAPFHRAFATLLHEYGHRYGDDGSRRFTDALTEIIEATLIHREVIATTEAEWQQSIRRIKEERSIEGVSPLVRLQAMSLTDIRGVFQKAPEEVLDALLGDAAATHNVVTGAKTRKSAADIWAAFRNALGSLKAGSRVVADIGVVPGVAMVATFVEVVPQTDDDCIRVRVVIQRADGRQQASILCVRPKKDKHTFITIANIQFDLALDVEPLEAGGDEDMLGILNKAAKQGLPVTISAQMADLMMVAEGRYSLPSLTGLMRPAEIANDDDGTFVVLHYHDAKENCVKLAVADDETMPFWTFDIGGRKFDNAIYPLED